MWRKKVMGKKEKKQRSEYNRTKLVGGIMMFIFGIMIVMIGANVHKNGSRWVHIFNNPRITNVNASVIKGSIMDRSGVLLAYEDPKTGERCYAQDRDIRLAVSQTVGDEYGMSGTGAEKMHVNTLLGFSGMFTDTLWQWMTNDGEVEYGKNITLTVDAKLSEYIAEQFPSGKNGAVVVTNYKTGEILSMVSLPNYDPYKAKTDAVEDSAYLNRCVQSLYTPGSVFKLVTLAALLEDGTIDYENNSYFCNGPVNFGGVLVRCAQNAKHGELSAEKALSTSCNVAFATMAYQLGADKMMKMAEKFGFNENFLFQDIVVYNSIYPEVVKTDLAELVWSAVGQSKVQVSPLHMALIAGTIANDGVMMPPKLIQKVTGQNGITQPRVGEAAKRIISAQTAQIIGEYMQTVVESGTGTRAKISGYTVCGKTGSAEISNNKEDATHAWFVGYIEDDRHPYAVAVVVESGGSGGSVAAPLAKKALTKTMELFD